MRAGAMRDEFASGAPPRAARPCPSCPAVVRCRFRPCERRPTMAICSADIRRAHFVPVAKRAVPTVP
jgi:hypothetical protein